MALNALHSLRLPGALVHNPQTKLRKPVQLAACGVITWATKACSRLKGCSSRSIVGCWQEAGWLLARPSPLSAAQCCSTAHNTSTGLAAGSVSPTKGLGSCHANCHFLSRSAQSAGGVNPGVIQLGTKGSSMAAERVFALETRINVQHACPLQCSSACCYQARG